MKHDQRIFLNWLNKLGKGIPSIIVMILLIIGAFFWPIIAGVALIVGFFKAMIERYKKL